jgi:glucosamine 6-phosphate synthetase-like amidotransferase/phosphosugar isomerase protein
LCGVIGLIFERQRADLGAIATDLLRMLEYRGYDSTGAVIQGETTDATLRKDVGAPSAILAGLGVPELQGQIFCGQVRWATFGAVNQANSQPHLVRCKTYLYGAHNGNVTNCDDLKAWLQQQGHTVCSDNDGEMVVHTVEHFFAERLQQQSATQREDPQLRRRLLREAVRAAGERLKGSYAAVIVDPVGRSLCAIKMGSSLYFGVGHDDRGDAFGIASSDLSSVLRLTRVLVPLAEQEMVQYGAEDFSVFAMQKGDPTDQPLSRRPVRSRLRAQDAALEAPYRYYMEQEIAAQEANSRQVISLLEGGSASLRQVQPALLGVAEEHRVDLLAQVDGIRQEYRENALRDRFLAMARGSACGQLLERLPARFCASQNDLSWCSEEKWLCEDLWREASSSQERGAARLLDVLVEAEEVEQFSQAVQTFCRECVRTVERGRRIYVVCCGPSFHAAKAASLFFNDLAAVEVQALLPGEFRAQHSNTIRAGDLIIAVSQSGETKDLIDILNQIQERQPEVFRVAVVNNVNSTLAQEKSDVVIPLRCGSEIAVPATKSFTSQLAVFYFLAGKLAEERGTYNTQVARPCSEIPDLIQQTLQATEEALEEAAELLYLEPSIHILATRLLAVAKEGALKIREVVLNHTEGFEGSEFKHGPNTILGFNTVLGPRQVETLLQKIQEGGEGAALPAPAELYEAMRSDYPLVYISGPDPRDVALTVSQINTHKIRGSLSVIIAEDHPDLRGAAFKPPAGNTDYRAVYVPLPKTDSTLLSVFSASVALQRLAFKMSLRKMAYLDSLGIQDHGVHPDVPKNVSKSITVD